MLRPMRPRASLVVIATGLTLAACGGSSSSSTTSQPATSSSSTTTSDAGAVLNAGTSTTASGVSTTTTTSAGAPPEVPKHKRPKHQSSSGTVPAASQGAHVQADVDIMTGGALVPPVVSVPTGVDVEIRFSNESDATHTVSLDVPTHPSLQLVAHAGGPLETAGLQNGTYQILIDGSPRGQVMIGTQGGP
jgi:hypothetical protein